ncbi:O-antigen ligase family protein [Shewanella algae]|uniref:O-antigen ligase family protein n=1 Tax=Shewanella algae TaxID=38313 RepID=UPI0011838AE7|nr:O-antigen ligase family protein [Shewanella algae]
MSKYLVDVTFPLLLMFIMAFYFIYIVFSGQNLNDDAFTALSRNFVSICMLFSFSYVYMSRGSDAIKLFSAMITLFVSFLAVGRSGIFSSLLIFIFLIFTHKGKWFKWALLVTVPFLVFFFWDYIEGSFDLVFNKLNNQGVTDEYRKQVLECYFTTFDINSLFLGINSFGGDYCGTLAIGVYAPHNSLLSLASNSGVISFVLFLPLVISFKYKKLRLTAFVLSAYVLRSFTDTMMFYTFFDVFYWWFVFILLKHLKISHVQRLQFFR